MLGLTPAMRAAVARARRARGSPGLTRPRFALPFWLAVWYGVHLPAFYDYALRHPWLLNLEHAMLLVRGAALLVAGVLRAAPARLSTAVALVYLGAAYVGSAFLSLALDLLRARVLRLLRGGASALGAVAREGPEPRRDPDERRADDRLLRALSYFLMRLLSEEEEAQRALEG